MRGWCGTFKEARGQKVKNRSRVEYTLTAHPSSQRTSLKFLPRLELLLRKHTLMIFTGKMLSLATVAGGGLSWESDGPVGDMLLQHRVLLSPDITHTHTHTHTHTLTHGVYATAYRRTSFPSLPSLTQSHETPMRRDALKLWTDGSWTQTINGDVVAFETRRIGSLWTHQRLHSCSQHQRRAVASKSEDEPVPATDCAHVTSGSFFWSC